MHRRCADVYPCCSFVHSLVGWGINEGEEEVRVLSSGLTRLVSPPSQSRTRIFSSVTIFALLLFAAIGFSAGKVESDVIRGEFGVEYVLGSEMLLCRFLTASVFRDDTR